MLIPYKVFVHSNSKVFNFGDPFDWSSIYVYLQWTMDTVFSTSLLSLAARGETGESYFTGFIVAVIIGVLLLLVVVVLAYQTYTNRKQRSWNNGGMNGHGNKNMEPFLLDSEDADSNGDTNSFNGYPCPKGRYRDEITMSNL